MEAKPVMTNKLERGTRRWNLQMCSLSASRHKSRRGVQIEFHYSFARRCQGSLFIGAGQGRRTKDPLYELCAVHAWEQMLSKVSFTHLSDSLSPLSVSKLLRFPPLCSACTAPSIINPLVWKQVLDSSTQLSSQEDSRLNVSTSTLQG